MFPPTDSSVGPPIDRRVVLVRRRGVRWVHSPPADDVTAWEVPCLVDSIWLRENRQGSFGPPGGVMFATRYALVKENCPWRPAARAGSKHQSKLVVERPLRPRTFQSFSRVRRC